LRTSSRYPLEPERNGRFGKGAHWVGSAQQLEVTTCSGSWCSCFCSSRSEAGSSSRSFSSSSSWSRSFWRSSAHLAAPRSERASIVVLAAANGGHCPPFAFHVGARYSSRSLQGQTRPRRTRRPHAPQRVVSRGRESIPSSIPNDTIAPATSSPMSQDVY